MKYTIVIILLLLIAGGGWYYLDRSSTGDDQVRTATTTTNTTQLEESTETPIEETTGQATSTNMETDAATTSASSTPQTATKTIPAPVREFKLSGFMFGYTPAEMRVTQGDTVKVVFTSTDGLHDWVVDEFNARTSRVQTGQTTEVTFVANRAGTYEFYRSVGSHRANGMVGTLIVDPR